MLLDETFRVEPTGSRRWKFWALGVLVILGAACSLATLQPAHSADKPAQAANPPTESKAVKKTGQVDARSPEEVGSFGEYLKSDESSCPSPYVMATVPGRMLLSLRSVQAELNLTTEQKKKLADIVDGFLVEERRFVPRRQTRQPPALLQPLATLEKEETQLHSDTCKRMDEVLTAQQLTTLKNIMLRTAVFSIIFDPAVLGKLGMTTEQRGELIRRAAQLANESQRKIQQASWEIDEKALAVLSPQQRAQLQEEVLRPGSSSMRMFRGADLAGVPVPRFDPFPDPDLRFDGAGNELGLSPVQQDQVRAIMKKYEEQSHELDRQWHALSQESNGNWRTLRNDRLAVSEKSQKLVADRRKQIEGILTPQQLESYKRMALRNVALTVLNDPDTLWRIGATKEQNSALGRLQLESIEKPQQIARETAGKVLKLLTPSQQEILREEADKHGGN